jgi:hypothetical protein
VLSTRSDVFSFGVVLLEIVTGREPLDVKRPRDEWSLVEWVCSHYTLWSSIVHLNQMYSNVTASIWRLAMLCPHPLAFVIAKIFIIVVLTKNAIFQLHNSKNNLTLIRRHAGKTLHKGVQDRRDGGSWHKRAVLFRGHVESA